MSIKFPPLMLDSHNIESVNNTLPFTSLCGFESLVWCSEWLECKPAACIRKWSNLSWSYIIEEEALRLIFTPYMCLDVVLIYQARSHVNFSIERTVFRWKCSIMLNADNAKSFFIGLVFNGLVEKATEVMRKWWACLVYFLMEEAG